VAIESSTYVEGDDHIRLTKAVIRRTFLPHDACSGYAMVDTGLYGRWTCSYCKGVRVGESDECSGCGAPRWE
jgi:hypothetical protein